MERVPPQQLLDLSLAVPMPPPPPPPMVEGGGDPASTGAGAGAAGTGNGSAGVPTTPMTMMLPFGAPGDMGFAGGGTVLTGLEALDLPQGGAASLMGGMGGMGLPAGVAVAGEEAMAGGVVMGMSMQTGSDAASASLPSAAAGMGESGPKKKVKKGLEQEQGPGGAGPEAGMTVDQLCEYNVAQLWHKETQAIEEIDPGALVGGWGVVATPLDWCSVTDEARPLDPPTTTETTDFMKQELPLTRIKKIIKQDEEVEGTPKFVRSLYCIVSPLLMIDSPP